MIIKKLFLSSFGKFTDKEVDLSQGVNVIYGLNEAGKSTVHKFIEGMFFGFLVPGKTRKIYTRDHAHYKPHNKSDYYGSILVNYKNKDYLIKRNFLKRNPSIDVLDYKTARDITDKLKINGSSKLPDIAGFFGMDYTLYNNTISISQMLNETSNDLATVLVEKLTNMHSTKDETISLKKVTSNLDARLSAIGTTSAKTKPLYRTKERVFELEEELSVSKEKYTELTELSNDTAILEVEISSIDVKLSEFDKKKKAFENTKLKEKYYKGEIIQKEYQTIEDEKNNLVKFKDLSENDYIKARDYSTKISGIKKQLELDKLELTPLLKEKQELDNSLQELLYFKTKEVTYNDVYKKYSRQENLSSIIEKDKEEYKNIERKLNVSGSSKAALKTDYIKAMRLQKEIDETNLESLKQELERLNDKSDYLKKTKKGNGIVILYVFLILAVIGVFLLVAHFKAKKELESEIKKANQKSLEIKEMINEKTAFTSKTRKSIAGLYFKYGCDDEIEFKTMYDDNYSEGRMQEERNRRYEELGTNIRLNAEKYDKTTKELRSIFQALTKSEIINESNLNQIEGLFIKFQKAMSREGDLQKRINEQTSKVESNTDNLEEWKSLLSKLLKRNHCESLDEFETNLEKHKEFLIMSAKLVSIKKRLEDLLGYETLEELKNKVDFKADEEINEKDLAKLELALEGLRSKKLEKAKQMSALLEQIKSIEDNYRDLSVVEVELIITQGRLDDLELSSKSVNLVKQIIKELSDEIKYEFAPKLNDEISKVIEKITKGKYNDIRLDRDIDIKMFDTTTKTFQSIKNYSAGTIDQIYLSMRIGINKTISDGIYPFIFDDSFVNYDYHRLGEVLGMISEEALASKRQVLLFTCQTREELVMADKKLDYRLLEIV